MGSECSESTGCQGAALQSMPGAEREPEAASSGMVDGPRRPETIMGSTPEFVLKKQRPPRKRPPLEEGYIDPNPFLLEGPLLTHKPTSIWKRSPYINDFETVWSPRSSDS